MPRPGIPKQDRAVAQRKVTNGYRAMWAAAGEADVRTVVDTARLSGADTFATIFKTIGSWAYCRGRG